MEECEDAVVLVRRNPKHPSLAPSVFFLHQVLFLMFFFLHIGRGRSTVGMGSVGRSSVGRSSVGLRSVGLSSAGLSSVGLSSAGPSSVGLSDVQV